MGSLRAAFSSGLRHGRPRWWLRLAVLGVIGVAGVLVLSGAALANVVSISGSMEGSIRISNGDFVAAGYRFTIPGSHPETHVLIANASVVFHGTCSNGSSQNTLTINLRPGPVGGGSYDVPANSSAVFPTNDEKSPAAFQGSVVANVCGGGNATLDASRGATFRGDVQADHLNKIQIAFHYRDPAAKGKGNYDCSASTSASLGADKCGASWSGTIGLVPDQMTGGPHIFLGYADSDHDNQNAHPTPWQGSPNVIFEGCGFGGSDMCATSGGVDIYDAGAIRIDAPSSAGLTVSNVTVQIGSCSYNPWPGLNVNVPAGNSLILTQTGTTPRCTTSSIAEQDNFDTSESFLTTPQYQQFLQTGHCSNDGLVPKVMLTINSQAMTVNDTGQVLNRGGIDPDICTGINEAQDWVQVQ
jgi:hypothetical protein